ncbi:hypothetical protein RND81_04G071900 [Saponaria officinalis]|uniref:Endonuclease/exonuclease/phosphatase domain-containing protein n=1 Tax=Saponaria officinalis TaxID=3572 RepID=A0AAW1LKD7_SAPOF
MKIGVWNVCGLNERTKQAEAVNFFKRNNLDLMGIIETRVREGRVKGICRQSFHLFQIINNYDYHPNGRIWIIWKKSSLNIQVLSRDSQWIHVRVNEVGRPPFIISFIYAFNTTQGRTALWDFLKGAAPSLPWVALGDFNCVRRSSERISSPLPDISAMTAYNDALYSAGLEELTTHGCPFTWTNKQDSIDRKWMSFDRAVFNALWQSVFPASVADVPTAGLSDHSPVLVSVWPPDDSRPKQFRFLNCWVQDGRFLILVKEVWREPVYGSPMYRLVSHLKSLKDRLKQLHGETYSSISARIDRLTSQLKVF